MGNNKIVTSKQGTIIECKSCDSFLTEMELLYSFDGMCNACTKIHRDYKYLFSSLKNEDKKKRIMNYNEVVISSNTFFQYKGSIWDLIVFNNVYKMKTLIGIIIGKKERIFILKSGEVITNYIIENELIDEKQKKYLL